MSTPTVDQTRLPRLGDRVQTVAFPHSKGRIIEFRGPIGYKGRELYGVEIDFIDHTMYVEFPRDEFVLIDDGNDPEHPNPPATTPN